MDKPTGPIDYLHGDPRLDAWVMVEDLAKAGVPSDAELRTVARRLMQQLDMIRASEGDFEAVLKTFRAVFDLGRARGLREADSRMD